MPSSECDCQQPDVKKLFENILYLSKVISEHDERNATQLRDVTQIIRGSTVPARNELIS
jgi:hypothetical protein